MDDLECEDISLKAFYPGQEFQLNDCGEMSITSIKKKHWR